jgi:hypothetical protein
MCEKFQGSTLAHHTKAAGITAEKAAGITAEKAAGVE